MPSILNSSTSGFLKINAVKGAAYRFNLNDLSTMSGLVGGNFNAGHSDTTSTAMPTTTSVFGVQGSAYNYSGTISNSYGVYGQSFNTSANATTTNAYGVYSWIGSNNSNVGTGYGFYATTGLTASGTIGTYYGLYLADPSTTGITNRYGIYQENSLNRNYFAGNVGIGTTSPSALLSVGSTSQFQVNSAGAISTTGGLSVGGNQVISPSGVWVGPSTGLVGPQGPAGATGPAGASPWGLYGSNTYYTNGNVGIGTTNPSALLDVETPSTAGIRGILSGQTSNDSNGGFFNLLKSRSGAAIQNGDNLGSLATQAFDGTQYINAARIRFVSNGAVSTGSIPTDIQFLTGTGGGGTERVRIVSNGNVGIGTTNPQKKLHIAGDVEIDGQLFFGGIAQGQSAPYAGCGADYAESVDVTGDRTKYEPGDVLVIDPKAPGKFLKSNEAYSTMASGVYSTKPGFVGRFHEASDPASADEIPMAMLGRVPTKVTAENGPIQVGDLLVTSSTMGYAMKGTDRSRLVGAVIGKALGSLDSGTGTIMVLITLQ
ncbi:hypothetical protein [Terriglobus albidus]|uniref:hypothetical protein n=1 Tax=Terriglobus albidus TaxID=1592106 RepID=UPI0021DF42AC|nr:hypothetical protein [Terriglobus albidus]